MSLIPPPPRREGDLFVRPGERTPSLQGAICYNNKNRKEGRSRALTGSNCIFVFRAILLLSLLPAGSWPLWAAVLALAGGGLLFSSQAVPDQAPAGLPAPHHPCSGGGGLSVRMGLEPFGRIPSGRNAEITTCFPPRSVTGRNLRTAAGG